jgi:hypothetical protein
LLHRVGDLFELNVNSGAKMLIVSIRHLVCVTLYRWPFGVKIWMSSLIHTCTPNGHSHRVTYTRCRIDTINSPDDGHMAAWNMSRMEINIHGKELCINLVIYKDYTEMLHGQQNKIRFGLQAVVTSVDGLIFCIRVTQSFRGVKSSAELRKVRHYLACKTAAFFPKVYY